MEQNIDLSHADKDGMTALHCACAQERGAARRLLLGVLNDEKRSHALRVDEARVDARDKQGRTALHHAAVRGDPSIVEMLVAAGADPASTSKANKTPADLAGSSGAFAALAAATRAVDRRERFEGGRAAQPRRAREGAGRRVRAPGGRAPRGGGARGRDGDARQFAPRGRGARAAAAATEHGGREGEKAARATRDAAAVASREEGSTGEAAEDKLDAGITAAASEPPAAAESADQPRVITSVVSRCPSRVSSTASASDVRIA